MYSLTNQVTLLLLVHLILKILVLILGMFKLVFSLFY
jgi:hypothetical protein